MTPPREIESINSVEVHQAIATLLGVDVEDIDTIEIGSYRITVNDPQAYNGHRYYHLELS